MKLPTVIKRNLSVTVFILIIPLGILVGYFFSNIKGFVSGGYRNILTPFNKMLYVAKVDGVGIPKSEWENMLKSRYGQSAAKNLIDVYTIRKELKRAGINVSEEEINAEIATIEKQLAGQSLEAVLKQEGGNLNDFRKDLSLQVGMKKLLSGKVVVTDQEISDFVTASGATLDGTTDEEKKTSAKKALTDQKLGNEIGKWFTDVQSKVKVENYLEQ